jgi:hypothetical protein
MSSSYPAEARRAVAKIVGLQVTPVIERSAMWASSVPSSRICRESVSSQTEVPDRWSV